MGILGPNSGRPNFKNVKKTPVATKTEGAPARVPKFPARNNGAKTWQARQAGAGTAAAPKRVPTESGAQTWTAPKRIGVAGTVASLTRLPAEAVKPQFSSQKKVGSPPEDQNAATVSSVPLGPTSRFAAKPPTAAATKPQHEAKQPTKLNQFKKTNTTSTTQAASAAPAKTPSKVPTPAKPVPVGMTTIAKAVTPAKAGQMKPLDKSICNEPPASLIEVVDNLYQLALNEKDSSIVNNAWEKVKIQRAKYFNGLLQKTEEKKEETKEVPTPAYTPKVVPKLGPSTEKKDATAPTSAQQSRLQRLQKFLDRVVDLCFEKEDLSIGMDELNKDSVCRSLKPAIHPMTFTQYLKQYPEHFEVGLVKDKGPQYRCALLSDTAPTAKEVVKPGVPTSGTTSGAITKDSGTKPSAPKPMFTSSKPLNQPAQQAAAKSTPSKPAAPKANTPAAPRVPARTAPAGMRHGPYSQQKTAPAKPPHQKGATSYTKGGGKGKGHMSHTASGGGWSTYQPQTAKHQMTSGYW